MSSVWDERRVIDDMLGDIELELASIRLMTDRGRLDQGRHAKHAPDSGTSPAARVIDTRGIDINRTAADSLPKPAAPTRQDRMDQARVSLAERLAVIRAEAAE